VAVEGFFAFLWFGWGQAAPPSWLVVPLAAGGGLAVLLTVAGVVLTMRSAGPLRVMSDRAVRRRYSIIVGLEFGLLGVPRVLASSNTTRGVEGMDGATVPVAVVTSRAEAELIVGMLRNNGLRAAVSADDAGEEEPQLQLQGVRVLVAPSDEAPARRLIAAAGDTPS
jgi:hypothetical protein